MLYRDQTFQSNPRAACSCSQPAQIFCWQQLLSPTGLTIGPCISLLSTPALRLAASTRACCSMAAISSRLHFDRSCIQGEENHKEGIQLYSLLLAPGRAAPWQPSPAVSILKTAAFKGWGGHKEDFVNSIAYYYIISYTIRCKSIPFSHCLLQRCSHTY